MVGAFGEVQVMDWGLAKVLRGGRGEPPVAEEQATRPSQQLTIRPAGPPSRPGVVVGTPAYMPPEQASGQTDRLDERCDVFGLGAILCEILTGLPPHAGDDSSILDRVARADLADALARLDGCGADAELLGLARRCLAARAADRPRDAGALAAELTGYLESVDARLRQAELARVEAQARAEEEAKRRVLSEQLAVEAQHRAAAERRRRRATLALAAAVLALVVLGSGGLAWTLQARAAHLARLDGLLGQVEDGLQRPEILAAPAEWEKVRVALGQAEELAAGGVDAARGDRLRALKGRAVQVETTRALLAELEEIRVNRGEHLDHRRTDREYEAAFRRAGLDLDNTTPAEAGAWVAVRPHPIKLASYLDDWAALRRKDGRPEAAWRGLVEAAQLADPDPWRNQLRKLMGTRPEEATRALSKLADDTNELEGQPAESLLLLALLLRQGSQDRVGAERVLRLAQARFPGDFWVYLELTRAPGVDTGDAQSLYPRPEEAVRYLTAAVALRPHSAAAHSSLGNALRAQGNLAEAVTACTEAVRLGPAYAEVHNNLGAALQAQGKLAEAVASYQEAIRLQPDFAEAHYNLGNARRAQGNLAEAVAAYKEAIRLRPDLAQAHTNLGVALRAQGKVVEAVAAHKEAIRHRPDLAQAHTNLGVALQAQGKLAEAVASYQEAIRLRPDLAEAHYNLGNARRAQGNLAEAVAAYKDVIRLRPDLAQAHSNLGVALRAQGKLAEAVAAHKEAIRLRPAYAEAHYSLGVALYDQGNLEEALAAFRQAEKLRPSASSLARALPGLIRQVERQIALAARLGGVLKGDDKPTDAAEGIAFAQLCATRKLHAAATRLYAAAFAADARLVGDRKAGHRYNAACSAALAGCGKGKDDPPPDEAARVRLRRQALDWLRAERADQTRVLKSGRPADRSTVQQRLEHWRRDPDLAGLRDPEALAKLPVAERADWQKLWAEVEGLLSQAGEKPARE
jgi:tetratricopeptide (TPR) repeat protein